MLVEVVDIYLALVRVHDPVFTDASVLVKSEFPVKIIGTICAGDLNHPVGGAVAAFFIQLGRVTYDHHIRNRCIVVIEVRIQRFVNLAVTIV